MINCWKFSIQLACYAYGVRHRSTLAPDKLGSLVPPPPKIPELAKPNPHARTAKPSKTLKRKHVMQQASLRGCGWDFAEKLRLILDFDVYQIASYNK